MSKLKRTLSGMLALSLLALAAAPYGAAAQSSGTTTYEVTVTNITNSKQALSPPIVVTHPRGTHAWQVGQPASPGVEKMAEEGMTDVMMSELQGSATDVKAASAPLMPGESVKLMISAREGDVLSAATMLVQTNDGFTGLDAVTLNNGSTEAMAYDAGTEENTEARAHVPGPPFGGMNAGTETSPRAAIAVHTGIKGTADVTPDFNWSGPVARFTVSAASTTTAPMPGMPDTGAADVTLWLVPALAVALAFTGLALRRRDPARR